jgi:transposase
LHSLGSTVERNIGKGVPTYVIVDSDTVSNENIDRIRKLELLNIIRVVHQIKYQPKHHELIRINLIEPTDNIGYE